MASGSQSLFQTADYLQKKSRSFKKKVRKDIEYLALEEYNKKLGQYTKGVRGRLFEKLIKKGLKPKDPTLYTIATEPEFLEFFQRVLQQQQLHEQLYKKEDKKD